MFIQDVPKEAIGVGEALRARALPDAHDAVLLGVKDAALWGGIPKIWGEEKDPEEMGGGKKPHKRNPGGKKQRKQREKEKIPQKWGKEKTPNEWGEEGPKEGSVLGTGPGARGQV